MTMQKASTKRETKEELDSKNLNKVSSRSKQIGKKKKVNVIKIENITSIVKVESNLELEQKISAKRQKSKGKNKVNAVNAPSSNNAATNEKLDFELKKENGSVLKKKSAKKRKLKSTNASTDAVKEETLASKVFESVNNEDIGSESACGKSEKLKKAKSKKKKSAVALDEGKETNKEISAAENEEVNRRTIFVGNVPTSIKRIKLRKLFSKYGKVQSVRLRNVVPEDPKLPRKVAAIKNQYHPKLTSITAYVVFENEHDARKALELNGEVFQEHYLRVEISGKTKAKPVESENKAVFLGNLSIKISDNALWEHFKECGKITSVRVVRDNQTGVGKGFGYVNFTSEDAVYLALELDGTEIMNRPVRVQRCSYKSDGKKKQKRPVRTRENTRENRKKPKHQNRNFANAKNRHNKKLVK